MNEIGECPGLRIVPRRRAENAGWLWPEKRLRLKEPVAAQPVRISGIRRPALITCDVRRIASIEDALDTAVVQF